MNKNILICEDDEGIVEAIKIVLEEKGFSVYNSLTVQDLMENIQKLNPRLILLDLWMPNLDGEEVAKKLKKDPSTKRLPIVIISASKETKRIARETGVEDYICKPFEIEYLEEVVEKYAV